MLDLSSNYVIPHVEQKIRILNQQVIFCDLSLLELRS